MCGVEVVASRGKGGPDTKGAGPLLCHTRPCASHPRLSPVSAPPVLGGRARPGYDARDGDGATRRGGGSAPQRQALDQGLVALLVLLLQVVQQAAAAADEHQ